METGPAQTVLVVDDEPDLVEVARRVLIRQNYTVLTANSAGDGVRRLREFADAIHLLVTDVRMPDGTGREVADAARSTHPETRILYMSGLPDYHPGVADLHDDDAPILAKPFTAGSLVSAVRSALDPGTRA
ncbi:MAG TPA: response regulator [Micromonosporaceae bacterium]|nr:response regulator [Micromonosporaceae bacterium]